MRGLTLSGDGGGGDADTERRVSGGDLDTAADDDVSDLLAGLDSDHQAPPSKRVRQERREGGKKKRDVRRGRGD